MIVVSGGTKGIGKAIIEAFNDTLVLTCSRSQEDIDNLSTLFPNQEVLGIQADLSLKQDVKRFSDFVLGFDKGLDMLVNNAGVFFGGSMLDEDGVLENLIETNLYSAYYLTQYLSPKIIAQKTGKIINIVSVAGETAYPSGGAYAISKHAMMGFSDCLREEMKPHNVAVSAVLPGATFTRSWEGVDLPKSRFIKASDVAKTVRMCYELSEQAVAEKIVIRPQEGDI